jgi:hypothetical protein
MSSAIRALSLYLDTSVIGGYFDAEFRADTRPLAAQGGKAVRICLLRGG